MREKKIEEKETVLKEFLLAPIREISADTRAKNALQSWGFKSVYQVVVSDRGKDFIFRNFGDRSRVKLNAWFLEQGVTPELERKLKVVSKNELEEFIKNM